MSTPNHREGLLGHPYLPDRKEVGGRVLGFRESGFSPAVPPTFENPKTETVSQVAGSPLVLSCDVTAVPAPSVTWLKDRMPVGECISPYLFGAK